MSAAEGRTLASDDRRTHAVPLTPETRHGTRATALCGAAVQVSGYVGGYFPWRPGSGNNCSGCAALITGR